MSEKITAGIVGGSGYTGAELIRLLSAHKKVSIEIVTSRKEAGMPLCAIFPHLHAHEIGKLTFSEPDIAALSRCDVVFFATPHGVCQKEARALIEKGVKVIDLSADFRLKNPETFAKWYGEAHGDPLLLQDAVYGLPEIWRDKIATAKIIACAGCYPTAVQLGFYPLLKHDLIEKTTLIADVKSGVSGAGRDAKVGNLFAEMGESFKAYAAAGHRHQPEIEQGLNEIASNISANNKVANDKVSLVFVPHLLPMIRGIEATLYAKLKPEHQGADALENVRQTFIKTYENEAFIHILPAGICPETRSVRGSNHMQIGLFLAPDEKTIIISVVEDNLVKGAAGQAVQCMNILFHLPETTGLEHSALLP